MTTVVCNREGMSSDSMLTGCYRSTVKKLWKHKGACIGVAGDYESCVMFIEWYKDRRRDAPVMDNVEAIVLTEAGAIFHYDGSLSPYEVRDDFSAIGSGSQAALAAMMMGASTKIAIGIAAKVDPYTGGRIQSMTIKGK